MPEGDSVLVAGRRLHAALAGQRVVRSDLRVPAFATSDLSGQLLREVAARGKHLLFRTDGGLTLHTHFRMEGEWHLYRPGGRWKGPSHEVRAVLETAPWVAVGFRLGIVELLPTLREAEVLAYLGPDVLGADWDPDEAVRRLGLDPDREIGAALIDQRVMAGPGNVYKSEACFLRGLDPWMRVGDVSDLEGLVGLVKRLMEANRTTGMQITTGDRRAGHGRWVYGRGGRPCRRCGTPVRRRAPGVDGDPGSETYERVTYWCPSCQPSRPIRSRRTWPGGAAGRDAAD